MYTYDRRGFLRGASTQWKAKKITDQDVKHQAQLYWSPRQEAYDPTMMGSSFARTLAPLLARSFAFDLASEFYFSRWNQDQAKAVEASILESDHPNAKNIARTVGLSVFNSHAGSSQPSQYWDVRYSSRLQDLTEGQPQLEKLGMSGAASKVSAYLKDVAAIQKSTEAMISQSVLSGLKKLGIDAALIGGERPRWGRVARRPRAR